MRPVSLLVLALAFSAGSFASLRRPPSEPVALFRTGPEAAREPVPLDMSEAADLAPLPRLNPGASARRAWLLAEGPEHAPGDERRIVTFTFDDGPFPETTPRVLKLLDEHHVRAAFFVIGRYLDGEGDRAERSRETLREVVARGHLVGNHTHDHRLLSALPTDEVVAQIDRGARSIEATTGQRPLLFRPPYGQLDLRGMELVGERRLELVLWNVEAEDMVHDDSRALFESLRDQIEARGGGVVLLHDIRPTTIPALADLLVWLRKHRYDPARPDRRGYEVVDLPTYLRETEAAPQPYATRGEVERARGEAFAKSRGANRAPGRDDES